jgi:hypothetical protein
MEGQLLGMSTVLTHELLDMDISNKYQWNSLYAQQDGKGKTTCEGEFFFLMLLLKWKIGFFGRFNEKMAYRRRLSLSGGSQADIIRNFILQC